MLSKEKFQKKITDTINKAATFLSLEQKKDGSFLSLSSPNSADFSKAHKLHSVFSTTLILSCLNSCKETPKIRIVKERAAKFLISQKNQYWSFNYWARSSKEAKKMPYPDDLDDTFCALSALFKFNPSLIDGKVLANIVNLLTSTEERVGGPYKTWLVLENADNVWKDVDIAVNINIAYFLSLQDISLPNLNKFIASKVSHGKIESPYYPNPYPIIYFISRFCQQKEKYSKELQKMLISKQKSSFWENPLYTALSVSSLFFLGISFDKLTQSITYLLSQQKPKGSFPTFAFCLDPALKGKTYYSGSEALTTAFCIEALSQYLTKIQQLNFQTKVTKNLQQDRAEIIYKQINNKIKKRLLSLDKKFRGECLESLELTLQKENKKQIALLPYYFKLALGKIGQNISDELLMTLGIANLFGWIAYTIYDNFLDNEGEVKKLSVANVCLRELTVIFNNILPETNFYKFFQKIMDQLDSANYWEVTSCRVKIINKKLKLDKFTIPDYKNLDKLAQRSLGHALTPIALLFYLGFNEKSQEVKSLVQFFKHYLTARQLNDDAHDWEKDLKMGQINSVGAMLLKKAKVKTNSTLSTLIPILQEIFWYEVIKKVCNKIFEHTQAARKVFRECKIISDYSLAERLLEKYEKGAKEALEERENAIKFLEKYQTS